MRVRVRFSTKYEKEGGQVVSKYVAKMYCSLFNVHFSLFIEGFYITMVPNTITLHNS